MVGVGLAFVCALVAWSAAAALAARCYRNPRLHIGIWVAACFGLMLALTAAFPGSLMEFSSGIFRLFQLGTGLLVPLWLSWGAAEYMIRSPQARFVNRLAVTTLTIVPSVVLLMDPVRKQFGVQYPASGDHYDLIANTALNLVHIFVLVVLVVCAVRGARRTNVDPALARHELSVLGLVAVGVLLAVLVSRFGLGVLGQLLLLGVIACIWAAVVRAGSPPEKPNRQRGRRRGSRQDGSDDGQDADEADQRDAPEREEQDVRRSKRGRAAEPEPAPAPRQSRLRGMITIYTLADGHGEVFDSCAETMVEQVGKQEPDTLMFTCHSVPSAPQQRIVYALYRDQLAYEEHEQQPHTIDFARKRAPYVAATNIIELALSSGSATPNLTSFLG